MSRNNAFHLGTEMTRPILSLIICVYNQHEFGAQVLTSVLAQRVAAPFEVLICDDGSADDYLALVKSYSTASTVNIRYIWQPDLGFRLSRSRNNAIRCAQGSILVFVDGDTWLTPTFLADHLRAHAEPNVLVCGQRLTVSVQKGWPPILSDALLVELRDVRQEEQRAQLMWMQTEAPWMACLGGNFSVRNSSEVVFDEGFQSWSSEDRDLAFRLFRAGLRPCLLSQPNAIHLRPRESGWQNMSHAEIVAFLSNKQRLRAKYPDGEMEPSLSLVRCCHYDSTTDRWEILLTPGKQSPDDVLDQFERWRESQAPSAKGWPHAAKQ